MNQSRLGPRKWAFVVVTGGALLALPFTQRTHFTSPPAHEGADILAALEPLVVADIAQVTNTTSDSQTQSAGQVAKSTTPLPAWAQAQQSPFDELMSQAAKVPSVPEPDVLPLQPLRPWITPPPKSEPKSESSTSLAKQSTANIQGSVAVAQTPTSASPWTEDSDIEARPSLNQVAAGSRIEPSKALPVDAWPDEHFSNGKVVSQLPPARHLQSAIVQPGDILTPQAAANSLAVTPPAITRQPTMRSVTAPKIRFGQSTQPASQPGEVFVPPSNMQPLPTLPESRRSHVIFQPTR